MSERFFSAEPITSDRIVLGGSEAHHLLHVMRARVGQQVTVFDDSGYEFAAEIESVKRSEASLRIVARSSVDRELPFPLAIGVALPKGERQKWLVEKLTELGVTTLVPLATERGVAQPTAGALDRLRRGVIEAAKQCGRNRLMQITEPQIWPEWVAAQVELGTGAGGPAAVRRLIAHPGGLPISELDRTELLPTRIAVGPVGGLSEAEVAAAHAAGWQSVDLGPRILRVETAAVALAAVVAQC